MAYAKSADLEFNMSLYDEVFNSVERVTQGKSPRKAGKKRQSMETGDSDKRERKRFKGGNNCRNFFGKYSVKEREKGTISNLLPNFATRVYRNCLKVSMPVNRSIDLGELEVDSCRSNVRLELAKKIPERAEDVLYDPWGKDRDLEKILCLQPGMKVS